MTETDGPSSADASTGRESPALDAAAVLRALARPRRSGTAGSRTVEADLRRRFEAAGYEVHELPFEFSCWPGRFGVPVIGLILGATHVLAAHSILTGRNGVALTALLIATILVVAGAVAARVWVWSLPWGRVATANWLVHRPGAKPKFVVMAHRDSKSQVVSLFLRLGAVAIAPPAFICMAGVAVASWFRPGGIPPALVLTIAAVGVASAVVLVLCYAGNASPGALDNASGLVALLAVAERERNADDVALLVTDGEELGLVGALVAARELRDVAAVINLDGLDDSGDLRVLRGWIGLPLRSGARLARIVRDVARRLGERPHSSRVPLGLMLDHVPFAEVRVPAVTIMRGRVSAMWRIHRPSDDATRMTGAGIVRTAAVVSEVLAELRKRSGRAR